MTEDLVRQWTAELETVWHLSAGRYWQNSLQQLQQRGLSLQLQQSPDVKLVSALGLWKSVNCRCLSAVVVPVVLFPVSVSHADHHKPICWYNPAQPVLLFPVSVSHAEHPAPICWYNPVQLDPWLMRWLFWSLTDGICSAVAAWQVDNQPTEHSNNHWNSTSQAALTQAGRQ